jgi:hypothetical protein
VDTGLQDLQGKAERVKPAVLLQRLLDIHAAKAALRRRHVAVARVAGQYDINNTYQYVIAREDQHMAWLGDAVRDMGGVEPAEASPGWIDPAKDDEALRRLAKEDAEGMDAFIAEWRPLVAEMTHARHRLMLNLMLGESLEQARLFHQAAAGQVDLIGRRTGGPRLPGAVLPTRWVE